METFKLFLIFFIVTCKVFAQQIPYNFNKKTPPTGRDWVKIIPKKVGDYILTDLKIGKDKCDFSAKYILNQKTIKIEGHMPMINGASCSDYANVTACGGPNGDGYQYDICTDKGFEVAIFKYYRYLDKSLSNKYYYFEVSAFNKKELDIFMNMFPY